MRLPFSTGEWRDELSRQQTSVRVPTEIFDVSQDEPLTIVGRLMKREKVIHLRKEDIIKRPWRGPRDSVDGKF